MKIKAKADAIMTAMDMYARIKGFYAEHNDFWCNPEDYTALGRLFIAIERAPINSAEERRVKNVYRHYYELAERAFESEWVVGELNAVMYSLQVFRFPQRKTTGYWAEVIEGKLRHMRAPQQIVTDLCRVLHHRDWFRLEVERSNGMMHPAIMQAWNVCSPADEVQLVMEWPHMAKDGYGIAYTRSEEHGIADRQTVTGVAKYLTRHFPGLPSNTIRDIAARYAPGVIKEVTTMAEMLSVIVNGPASCMGGKDTWDDDNHPYETYDPALGWSMVVYKEGSTVTGRVLVNDKQWVRTYRRDTSNSGYSQTDDRLVAWLSDNGYCKTNGWDGFKLKRIDIRRGAGFVAPYLDGDCKRVDLRTDYLLIDADGSYECDNTDGTATESTSRSCEDCNDRIDEDDGHWVNQDESTLVCSSCCDNNYTWAYSRRGDRAFIHNNDVIDVNDEAYDGSYLSDNNIVQTHGGDHCSIDDAVYIESVGEYYNSDSIDVCCAYDGEWELRNDCVELENGEYCLESDAWCCDHTGDWYANDEHDSVTTKCGKIVHEDYADEYEDEEEDEEYEEDDAEDDTDTGVNRPPELTGNNPTTVLLDEVAAYAETDVRSTLVILDEFYALQEKLRVAAINMDYAALELRASAFRTTT